MSNQLDEARRERNLIERLGAHVPGFAGYLDRELRREVDEALRRHLAAQLDAARREVAVAMTSLTLAQAAQLARLSRLDKELDALACRLRSAGAGYAGLFDAFKVREEQLERLYALDLSCAEDVQALLEAARGRWDGWELEAETLTERLHRALLRERPAVVESLARHGRAR